MKYLEELSVGESFTYNDITFILTTDFRNNGDRRCINLSDGSCKWINNQQIVNSQQIYILDENSNIIALKPTNKEYDQKDNKIC